MRARSDLPACPETWVPAGETTEAAPRAAHAGPRHSSHARACMARARAQVQNQSCILPFGAILDMLLLDVIPLFDRKKTFARQQSSMTTQSGRRETRPKICLRHTQQNLKATTIF